MYLEWYESLFCLSQTSEFRLITLKQMSTGQGTILLGLFECCSLHELSLQVDKATEAFQNRLNRKGKAPVGGKTRPSPKTEAAIELG